MKNVAAAALLGALIFGSGGFAAQAREHGEMRSWFEQRHFERMCANGKRDGEGRMTGMADRLAAHLKLSDPQKASLKDVHEAFLKSREDGRSVCSTKPDFATVPGRMAYDEALMTARLSGVKLVRAKMDVFYASLDEDQKTKFNSGYHRNQRGWRHPDDE